MFYSFLISGVNSNIPPGLVAVAKMNRKSRFFLASKENYFAGHKVETVMIDSGCNTVLLPIRDSVELESFREKFPPASFTWDLKESNGVSHSSICLRICRNSGGPIPIELCKDLITDPTSKSVCLNPPKGSSGALLRFHLCTDDMARLLKPDFENMFIDGTELLSNYLRDNKTHINRKKYALLGQALLGEFACVQLRGLMAVFHPDIYEPINGWKDMACLRVIVDKHALLPERFEDLEDEDHNEEAVDDEEYSSIFDMEYIDETGGEYYDW